MHRFFGQLKEVVTEKCQGSIVASTSMVDSVQKADKKADKAGSKLGDISRKRTVVEDNDIMEAELDVGELFS